MFGARSGLERLRLDASDPLIVLMAHSWVREDFVGRVDDFHRPRSLVAGPVSLRIRENSDWPLGVELPRPAPFVALKVWHRPGCEVH